MGTFNLGNEPDGPVGAGIDTLLMQDNRMISYAAGLNVNDDYELQGVRTLSFYGDREFKSLGYNMNFTIDSFILRSIIDGGLSLPGWQPDGSCNINSSGLYTFTALDIHTLIVLYTLIGCKFSGHDLTMAQGQLNTKNTRWRGYAALPGLQTS